MTPADKLNVHTTLSDHEPTTAQDIAKRLGLSIETVYEALVSLESAGRARVLCMHRNDRKLRCAEWGAV